MTTQLKDNTSFYAAWHSICAANKVAFEAAQCEYVYTQTLQPLLTSLTQHYGFDFNNASDALKGCVLSLETATENMFKVLPDISMAQQRVLPTRKLSSGLMML